MTLHNNELNELNELNLTTMTRKEFIQQAVISMAAKVIGQNGITDSCDWEHMVDEADDLANIVEEHGYGFDEE